MEIKLKSGRKVKVKEITLDERDSLLDAIEYNYKDDGSFSGVGMMQSTMTKWMRTCIDGDISDKALLKYTTSERSDLFIALQSKYLVGEEEASK
mgnify:CR=1 FL=1